MSLHFAQDLAEYVRGYLDQDDVTIPDSAVETFVRSVEGQIMRLLQGHPRTRVARSWALGAGDNVIPVPKDMAQLHSVKKCGKALTQYPSRQESEMESCGGGFINFGNCIKIWPIPAEPTTISLEMTISVPSLVDSEQKEPNWVATHYNDVYQYGVLSEAAGFMRDPQSQQLWSERFLQAVESLRVQGWNEKISSGAKVHDAR
jgi:hypothetical protein